MATETAVPSTGQIARVRQRRYLVEELVAPPRPGDSTLVRLSCVDDDNQGEPLEVLWEREIDAEVLSGDSWDAIAQKGFDQPKLFAAYLNTLKWNCVTSTDPRLLQSPFRAGIRLDAYQLEPLRKALRLPRVNLFIADDVGLGKTIEAGLIARELLLRKKAREIVVACPPSMLLQWQDELETRFGLTFEILDKDYVKRVRRERGFGVNPWSTHSRFLVSHRLLIDESYTANLLDWLGDFRTGTLLILDEAHHAAPASGQKYAIDSQFTRAIEELAKRFEHRLFLSATPHNGHSNSFSRLLEILDPQRFCRGVPVTQKLLDEVMVRRLKDDLRQIQGGFPERKLDQITIDGLPEDAPELKLSRLLDHYRQRRENRLSGETKRKQAAAGLLITGLQQRLLSSIEAFARTLRVHRKTVERELSVVSSQLSVKDVRTNQPSTRNQPLPTDHRQLTTDNRQLPTDLLSGSVGSDDDRAALPEDQLQAEEDAQFAAVTAATLGDTSTPSAQALFEQERKLLDEMAALADQSRALPDARVRQLVQWIRQLCLTSNKSQLTTDNRQPTTPWNSTRLIIFTEYDDTKRYLVQQLSAALAETDRAEARIAVYHGPTPPEEREAIKLAFNAPPDRHPVRILIATDAAREGLNLQAHCQHLFHFDVPWNPSRMEQRNGRIDRKLQPSPEVYCHYFFYAQRPEDRVIAALVRKSELIRRELGCMNSVLDSRLIRSLQQGIRRDQVESLEQEISATSLDATQRQVIDEELESTRARQQQLREQIDRLRTLLDDSRRNIGLDETHFQSAISCALELLGAQPLQPLPPAEPGKPPRAAFPAIDQREGADSTWADTVDTLRPRRPRDQKLWEWRRQTTIRPVVFEDAGVLDDDVVHLHLEHRIVQRLLGRFTAQGFVFHDLSRACLSQTSDAIPRVILLGRLCLYGPGAARLHEELIPVTARWVDPQVRKGTLAPYARDGETKTLALLDESLVAGLGRATTPQILTQLQQSAPRDIAELLPHLTTRGEEYAQDAAKKLKTRGEAEAKAMREILETQKKHIAETAARIDKLDPRQRRFDFGDDEAEQRQLEANRRYWTKRLVTLEHELQTEPGRIQELYQVRAQRIEPVGLVYLWPSTG